MCYISSMGAPYKYQNLILTVMTEISRYLLVTSVIYPFCFYQTNAFLAVRLWLVVTLPIRPAASPMYNTFAFISKFPWIGWVTALSMNTNPSRLCVRLVPVKCASEWYQQTKDDSLDFSEPGGQKVHYRNWLTCAIIMWHTYVSYFFGGRDIFFRFYM